MVSHLHPVLSPFTFPMGRVDLKLRYRWIKRCAKCCNCVNSLLFNVIVASHCLVEFGVWTSLTGYVSSPLWQRNCIALHRWCVLTAFSLWKPGNAVGNNASYSLFHRCCARELTCPNCPSCPIQYFIPRQLHLRPSSSRLNSHFPIYTPGTGYLYAPGMYLKPIWVSFCRTGNLAVSRHIFSKSSAFVWPNLKRYLWFFNCSWLIVYCRSWKHLRLTLEICFVCPATASF